MSDNSGRIANAWKIVLAASGLLGLMLPLASYVGTYATATKEPFLHRQLDLCLKASEMAARLAIVTDKGDWERARIEFLTLYWGPLGVVEDVRVSGETNNAPLLLNRRPRTVVDAMVEFRSELEKGRGTPLPRSELEQLALSVAHACRDSTTAHWETGIRGLLGGVLKGASPRQ